jgi:hypothetical protein
VPVHSVIAAIADTIAIIAGLLAFADIGVKIHEFEIVSRRLEAIDRAKRTLLSLIT